MVEVEVGRKKGHCGEGVMRSVFDGLGLPVWSGGGVGDNPDNFGHGGLFFYYYIFIFFLKNLCYS